MAKACNCASLGLAFTAIGLFFMLLWASGQAVPASVENSLSQHHYADVKPLETRSSAASLPNESDCTSLNKKLCKYFDDKLVPKRMKHRNINNNNPSNLNEPTVKSSKNLHERQVRSLERSNKFTKNKLPNERGAFASYDNNYEFIRNISLDERLHEIMNNGDSVSMENISETTLATLKESDVKTNVPKEASDKIYLHVNGELGQWEA